MQGTTPLHAANGSAAQVIVMLGGSVYDEAQTGDAARARLTADTQFVVTDAGCKGCWKL